MRHIWVILAAVLFAVPAVSVSDASGPDVSDGGGFLIDYGNGRYRWIDAASGSTLFSAAAAALDAAGISHTEDSSAFLSVDGISETSVCSWRFYTWSSYSWTYGERDGGEKYASGTIALGYYPDSSVYPLPTPYYAEAWTQFGGDSSHSMVSGNTAPESIATPIEWVLDADRGSIDTALTFADGYLYCVAGGKQGKVGDPGNPCVCCINTETHELEWYRPYSSKAGYDIMTPLIVGDMLLAATGSSHIFMFDRTDGDILAELVPRGEEAILADSMDVSYYSLEPTVDSSGGSLISGSSFKGATNMVYDSGRLYFCTGDGCIRCFAVNAEEGFSEVWEYMPSAGDRGSFYYQAPTVTDVGGTRAVLAGNYAGRLCCVNADTGAEIWVRTYTIPDGTAGAVSGIVPASGGTAVVSTSDGGMRTSSGRTIAIDLSDGSELWSLDVYGIVTAADGTVYGYLSPSVRSDAKMYDKFGTEEDAEAGFYALSASTGRYIWKTVSDDKTESGMVYCDGRLYCVDYSPGTEWPSGGAVRCLGAETGSFVWSVRLSPYTGTAYSMSSVAIADGKIYATNDAGYIYCLSEVPSETASGSDEIDYRSLGVLHWSWLALFILCAAVAAAAYAAFRRYRI